MANEIPAEAPEQFTAAPQSGTTPATDGLGPSPGVIHDLERQETGAAADTAPATGAGNATPAPAPGFVDRAELLWTRTDVARALLADAVESVEHSPYLRPGDNVYAWFFDRFTTWAERSASPAELAEVVRLADRAEALAHRGAA